MSDLIKREDVVKEFGRVFGDLGLTLFGVGGNDLAQVIANAIPSAERKGVWIDTAPSINLVRCGECKHAEKCSQNIALQDTYQMYEKIDFCSYGEREGE